MCSKVAYRTVSQYYDSNQILLTYTYIEASTYSYLNEAGVGHDLFRIYYVHQGLHHSNVPNARHVKTIDVLPPCKHRENIFQDILKLVCV